MAAKKKATEQNKEQTGQETATAAVDTEQVAEQAAPMKEEAHGEDAAEQTPETRKARETPAGQEKDVAAPAPELESLAVLADRHRVTGWLQAALLRLMGWEDDKRVSDAEYRAALEHLKRRRTGGGRR